MRKCPRELLLLKVASIRWRQPAQRQLDGLHHRSLGLWLLAPVQYQLLALQSVE